MSTRITYLGFLLLLVFLTGCQKIINLNLPTPAYQLVVEGHIENGTNPYVILTHNAAYFSTFTPADIANTFVHGALITVSNGAQTDTLHELSYDTAGIVAYIYTDVLSKKPIVGQVGQSYSLYINSNGKVLTSVTTIPQLTPLDSVWVVPANSGRSNNDSLVLLMAEYTSPPSINVYVRYFTETNNEGFLVDYNSVFSNQLFYGKKFSFSLNSGIQRGDTSYNHDYPYFHRGDTITVKWSNIDQAQYTFWNTLEYVENNQGSPFSNPIVIATNINGGLGIWGGYGSTYKTLIVPDN